MVAQERAPDSEESASAFSRTESDTCESSFSPSIRFLFVVSRLCVLWYLFIAMLLVRLRLSQKGDYFQLLIVQWRRDTMNMLDVLVHLLFTFIYRTLKGAPGGRNSCLWVVCIFSSSHTHEANQ